MSREPSIQLKKSHLFNECNRDKVYPYTDAQYVYYTQTGTDEEKTVQEVLDGLLAKPDDTPKPEGTGLTDEQLDALKAWLKSELKTEIKQEIENEIRSSIMTDIELAVSGALLKQFFDPELQTESKQISLEALTAENNPYKDCILTFKGTHSTYPQNIDVPDFWLHKNAKVVYSDGATTMNVTGDVNINGEVNAKGLYDTSEESNEQGQ